MRWSPALDSRRTRIGSPCSAATVPARFCRCNRSGRSPKQSWISWRRALADLWERYLAQQIELGGAELVLSTAGQRGSGEDQGESGEAGTSDPNAIGLVKNSVGVEEQIPAPPGFPASPLPRWRQGAPPIPGPGLAITSPAHS